MTPTVAVQWCEKLFISENFFNVPFRRKIAIQVRLCQPQRMGLAVYNTAGEKVRTLRARSMLVEPQVSVLWDGANDRGEPVAAGVYLIRLEGDRGADSRMLIVLR